MTRRLSLSLAMCLGATTLLVATMSAPAAETPKGGTLRITGDDVDSVDPALGYLTDTWMLEYATCAKLYNHPGKRGAAGTRPVPEVVDRHTISNDGRTYTLTLKQTFRFHTGARVTARSFADAFNRDAQPRLQSPATAYMHDIVGADAVIDGRARSISGIEVLDRYRLRIRLTKPAGDLSARLTMPFFCPVLPDTPVDPGGIDNPAGSGPYYVAERIANQRTVLRRNRFYRGNRPANVDQIVWTSGARLEECRQAVEEDRADFCSNPGIGRDAARALVEKYGINRRGGQVFVYPSTATWFFVFNHDRPAFEGAGQIPLKKAINYAIDRPALTRAFGYLAGKRTDQMLPPAFARTEGIYPLGGADVAAARRWYAKAVLKPTKLVLYTWTIPPAVTAAQVLAYNLKQLGIDLEVKYYEPLIVTEKARTPGEPFDIVLHGFAADYADAAGFFLPLLGAGYGVNLDDSGLRRRVEAASRLTGDARLRAWADLDADLMRDNPPWAPFMHPNNRTFVSKSLGCFYNHPLYRVDIVAVCKK
jgi:peptide/nickel transport system substrate-binding protein